MNHCLICGKTLSIKRFVCDQCLDDLFEPQINLNTRFNIKGVFHASKYDGHIKTLIHKFKYEDYFYLYKDLSKLILRSFENHMIFNENTVITYPPSTIWNFSLRGYNPAELLAKEVAKNTGFKFRKLFRVKKHVKSQVKIKDPEERKSNVLGKYILKSISIKEKNVIIIDDVFTTGSTVYELAKQLKDKAVFIFTLSVSKS